MIKRLFDWTPRDIAYWEKIQARGMLRFILWYGLLITGGALFVVFGLITLVLWLRRFSGAFNTSVTYMILLGQLLFTALVCFIAGVVNGVITWWVEQRQYKKYKKNTDG